jgi:3-methyladenine DNA glycosylase AlkD
MQEMVDFVAAELAAVGDREVAAAMAAYMKTDMPIYGVKKPGRVPMMKELMARFPIGSRSEYEAAVRALWRQPHREEKYTAIALAVRYRNYITLSSVPLYRTMIVQGAWWDFVDSIAADLIGHVLLNQREPMSATLDMWIDDDDMWLRRTAIISQLRHKAATDVERLFRYSLKRANEKEFFIRKAIGWALREYAKTAPDAVRSFVLANRDAWSGLTYREATKHLTVP